MAERRDWMPLTSAEQREFDKHWLECLRRGGMLIRFGWKPQLRDQLPAHYKEMNMRAQPCPVQEHRGPFVYFKVRDYLGVDIDGLIGIPINEIVSEIAEGVARDRQSAT